MFKYDGKDYELIDGNIVDSRTYIVVCSEVATKICETFGVTIKQEQTTRERVDVAYLNSRIKTKSENVGDVRERVVVPRENIDVNFLNNRIKSKVSA